MNREERFIGGLRVVRLLGKGGMSEVYEAENPRLSSRHAVKLYAYPKDDDEVRHRFEVEGRLLAKLNHPRIVKVTDFGIDEPTRRPYFTMDLILGETGRPESLADVPEGEADEETIGRWYDDIRLALSYIHSKGVIHRDLKLQNILIGPDGHAVLTDFGISKIFEVEGESPVVLDTVQTIVKMRDGRNLVMGSLGYMAPELEMGLPASTKSDWYALGVIVYRLLTGTWCDARTDLLATLETYDPVWRRILPKLLHSNPEGRECLSYEDEKRKDREHSEFMLEERYLKEKGRGHFARHLARYIAVVGGIFALALLQTVLHFQQKVHDLNTELNELRGIPTFGSLFTIPPEAGENETDRMPARDQFEAAMVDALVLTKDMFHDLHRRAISREKARSELERFSFKALRDDFDLFNGVPEFFNASGENAALSILMRNAADTLKGENKGN